MSEKLMHDMHSASRQSLRPQQESNDTAQTHIFNLEAALKLAREALTEQASDMAFVLNHMDTKNWYAGFMLNINNSYTALTAIDEVLK